MFPSITAAVLAIGTAVLPLAGSVGTAEAQSAVPAAATTPGWPVTNYVHYVGGKAGAANPKLSPVYLGWVNQQGGSADLAPEATLGAQFAVKYVNQYLDGVAGHPLKLVECFIPDTVSAAAACGQKFANNPKIQQIVAGPVTIGNQAFEQALAPTKKLLNLFAGSTTDSGYKTAVWLYGSSTSLEGPLATFLAKDLKAKSVAIINENIPGSAPIDKAISDGLTLEHVKSTVVTFDPSQTDLTVPLEAAHASSVDAIEFGASGPICANFDKALKELNINKPVLANVTCIGPQIAKADGGSLPRWYYAVGSTLYDDPTDPAAKALHKVFAEIGVPASLRDDPWMSTTYSQILTSVKFMNRVGPDNTSAAKVVKLAENFHGPMLWGPPQLVCGEFKAAPQVCLDEDQFFRPNASGVMVRAQSWVAKPAGEPIDG
ncbi:MAG: ABC transporter substrate-binding protein [Acidimicrobiaceae bacterium]|nr:ABC transporter substrate-binding protein [Acidimicrobiaceae bacterium]